MAAALAGCGGPQSTLAPAGEGAEQIAVLFWAMAIGALVIWAIVIGLAFYAVWIDPSEHDERRARIWIIGGGAVVPTLLLTILLTFGLAILPALVRPAPEGSLSVEVTGLRWWWRVAYRDAQGQPVPLANEIRLPVDEPVQFELGSADAIHSFWIPSLGGKVDMIPGRRTRLALRPTKVGRYRGACAEYCGDSHAYMAFDVVVTTREEFDAWLAGQAAPAAEPASAAARRGAGVFQSYGCAACHAVRGHGADGVLGPDLTHLASRESLAAATVPLSAEHLMDWIARPESLKPGALMPPFASIGEEDLSDLAAYLMSLE